MLKSYVFLGLLSTIGVLSAYFAVLLQGGWQWGDVLPADSNLARQAATATFLGIVVMQIGTVFACLSERDSVFSRRFFSNKLIIIGIAVEVLLALLIIYHPIGNTVFGTAP